MPEMNLNTNQRLHIAALGITLAMLVGKIAGSMPYSPPMDQNDWDTLGCSMIASQAAATGGYVDPSVIDDCLAEIKAQSAFSD